MPAGICGPSVEDQGGTKGTAAEPAGGYICRAVGKEGGRREGRKEGKVGGRLVLKV